MRENISRVRRSKKSVKSREEQIEGCITSIVKRNENIRYDKS